MLQRFSGVILLLFTFFFFSREIAYGTIIDQIVAVVDNQIITQSDLHYQTLFSLEFPLLPVKDGDIHLQFAIDQILFLEDAERFDIDPPSDQEIQEKLNEIKDSFGSEETLDKILAGEGLTKDDLKEMINHYLISKKFIEERINFFIFISDNDIENYYKDHLSDWKGSSLEAVRNQINKILFEQKRKEKLDDFLNKRRTKAKIRINPPIYPDQLSHTKNSEEYLP